MKAEKAHSQEKKKNCVEGSKNKIKTPKVCSLWRARLQGNLTQQLCCLDPVVIKVPRSLHPRDKTNKENKTLQKDHAVFTSTAVCCGLGGSW